MRVQQTPPQHRQRAQRGFLVIEALVAILIFSLGILGVVAMGSTAVSAQSDARYRTDAAALADQIANRMTIDARRTVLSTVSGPDPVLAASLDAFNYLPDGTASASACPFTGVQSAQPTVTAWVNEVRAGGTGARGLPGATSTSMQIKVDTANGNRVDITICWQAPTDQGPRRHTLVTYIN